MYLSEDLIAIQGVVSGIEKKAGTFVKIKFRGGNEIKILDVVEGIRKFLCEKNYIKDGSINQLHHQQLDDLMFFLALNTEFKIPLELDEYSNLIHVIPPLSVCLLANIAYGLDLCAFYGNVIERLPLEAGTELLDEMGLCLKKAKPRVHLDAADVILKAAVHTLKGVEYSNKTEDGVDRFSAAVNAILQNLTGLPSDQTTNMKKSEIYQHMGLTVWKLLGLLLFIDEDTPTLDIFVKNVLDTCSNLLQYVTVDVFCEWAEVDEGDRPLQILVAESAYTVIEKYQNCKKAKSLITMLGAIARRPKTLAEKIAEADVPTIVAMVNKKNEDQAAWFKALLASNIANDKEALSCVSTWFNLSAAEDVARLLDITRQANDVEANRVVVKCASVLTVDGLCTVMTRHFYARKFDRALSEDVQPQLTLLFNKISENADIEDFTMNLCLQILQNPAAAFKFIFSECLRNGLYVIYVEGTLVKLKEVAAIDDVGVKSLKNATDEIRPCSQNIEHYTIVANLLLEIGYMSTDGVLGLLFDPVDVAENLEELSCVLQIILGLNVRILLTAKTFPYVQKLICVMSKCRCNFTAFDGLKQEITKYTVEILNKIERNPNSPKLDITSADCIYTKFYKTRLSSDANISMFSHLFGNTDVGTHIECVKQSLRFVPSCVTQEWLSIARETMEKCGCEETSEILSDMMILLCELTGAQIDIGKPQFIPSLTYCMQQFGIVMQDMFEQNLTLQQEKSVTRRIFRLLRLIPTSLKDSLGLPLSNVIPDRTLQQSMRDLDFTAEMLAIKHVPICETLGKRMFSELAKKHG